MERNTFMPRLFAWLFTIIVVVLLFLGARWLFNVLAIPVITFIFEMEGFIRAFEIILFILFALFLLFLGKYLIQLIQSFFQEGKIRHIWAVIGSVLCLLLIVYVLFTPYFYTNQYLQSKGEERLKDIALLTNDSLSKEERITHAKKTMSMGEYRQEMKEQQGGPLENIHIEATTPLKVERFLNTYTYTVEVEYTNAHDSTLTMDLWEIDLKPGFFTFLVEGYIRN